MSQSASNVEERKRDIRYRWLRNEDGAALPRPPPDGIRPPNGLIWASHPDRFFRIERFPGVNYHTHWSLSMIAEFNENYHEVADEIKPEPNPEFILPFPWLRLPVEMSPGPGLPAQTFWRSIQGTKRVGGLLRELDGFEPKKPVKFGNTYKSQFKLEEFIPAAYLPDILMVNDPKGITEGKRVSEEESSELEATPRKYKRVWPITDPLSLLEYSDIEAWIRNGRKTVAYLNLAGAPLLGRGHHSAVHRGALKLPLDLEAYTPDGSTGVAAKIAFPTRGARQFLEHEGEMYNKIYGMATNVGLNCIDDEGKIDPDNIKGRFGSGMRHLMENWSGFCLPCPDIHHPVPVNAVVPKFFGYYVPTEEAEEAAKKLRERGKEKADSNDEEEYWDVQRYPDREDNLPADTILSPILLVEDCGTPINPKTMSIDDRTECLAFLARLFFEDISHSSFYARNVLVQPGPLDVGPPMRSMKTPSYRIIDLGRAEHWDMRVKQEKETYKDQTGKDLPDERLPLAPDGFVRDDIQYTETQTRWRTIGQKWAFEKQMEQARAKKELLFEPW